MKFVKWLIKKYKNDNTPYGDLANDVYDDIQQNNLTQLNNYRDLKNRIILLSNNDDVLNTLDKVYEEYKKK